MEKRSIARRLWLSSPATYAEIVKNKYGLLQRRRPNPHPPVTREFLRSAEYDDLMYRHVPATLDYGKHEAQMDTSSFRFRAFKVDRRLRAWRWRFAQEKRDLLLDVFPNGDSKLVLDLGGAASPWGLGSVVVDTMKIDGDGNQVRYRSLSEVGRKADAVVTSHTLEHIPNLEEVLGEIRESLRPGGLLVAAVPSYTCERWRANVHGNAVYGDHVWTFGLSETKNVPPELANYANIDEMIGRFLTVVEAEYVGDDTVLVVGENR